MSILGMFSCANSTKQSSPSKSEITEKTEIKEDNTKLLNGKWVLEKFEDKPVKIADKPDLEIDLADKRINGTGGCNLYFTEIQSVSPTEIRFGVVGATKKMCYNKNIENEYFEMLEKTHYFKIDGETLILLNKSNKPILTFVRKK